MSSVVASFQQYLPATGLLLLPYAGNAISYFLFTRNRLKSGSEKEEWWTTLKRPWFSPPSWIFAPVWTALYASMGVASYMVFRHGGLEAQALPLAMYGAQLLVNWGWSVVYFGFRRIDLVRIYEK